MYSKVFARIAESSLMEEPISVRYTFLMLIAISDPEGYVIGTDVAIARRLNMSVAEFQECVNVLMSPDPNSNSKEEDGRRVVESGLERGYLIVNYLKYKNMKSETERREYMREYMKKYRSKPDVNIGKQRKRKLTHADADGKGEEKALSPEGVFDRFWSEYPKKVSKGDARKAWVKHKCDRLFGKIMSALGNAKRSAQWAKDDGQFIPYPASWLNAEGWEDVYDTQPEIQYWEPPDAENLESFADSVKRRAAEVGFTFDDKAEAEEVRR